MNKKIIVFGGTFNPPHNGHIELIKQAVSLCDLLYVIPTYKVTHKDCSFMFTPQQRYDMSKLMCESINNNILKLINYDDWIDSGEHKQYNYTFNVLNDVKWKYPNDDITFLMGMDCINTIHTWYNYEQLINQFNFIIFNRPNCLPINNNLDNHLLNKLKMSINQDILNVDISSSFIRNLINTNINDIKRYVPNLIFEYINQINNNKKDYVKNTTMVI